MPIPPFIESPTWLVFMIILFVVFVAVANAKKRRRWMDQQFGVKVCPQCGANLPPHANFCRQCGRRM